MIAFRLFGLLPLATALHTHIWHNLKKSPLNSVASTSGEMKEDANLHLYCDQKIDHFSEEPKGNWCQRYFMNSTFFDRKAKGSRNLVFVCVGGEGPPMSGAFVTKSNACDDMLTLAAQVNALVFAVEHRYYGPEENCPSLKNVSTSTLQTLFTSRQALADLAEFHGYAVDKYIPKGEEAVWISFGSSYPGMLSSWTRLLYPDKFLAAVASSAPVLAQLDFPEYNEVVGTGFSNPLVGGSVECATNIHFAHERVGTLLAGGAEGRRGLEKLFNVCGSEGEGEGGPLDPHRNQQVWASGGLLGGFSIQSNDPSCSAELCNVHKICERMTDRTSVQSLEERLASIASHSMGGACMEADFEGYMARLRDPNRRTWDSMWLFQTCNEFGFYQTCPSGERGRNCLWIRESIPDLDSLEFSLLPCQEAYGMSAQQVKDNIRKTNEFYGGRNPISSLVLYPNGGVDPWHALGVLVAPRPDLPTLWVPSASHHYWTHLPSEKDFNDIRKSREAIHEYVKRWVCRCLTEEDKDCFCHPQSPHRSPEDNMNVMM